MPRDSLTVSKNMRKIHSKDTSIELQLRKALWHKGYHYRKNYKALPGSPDIVLTKYKIAIFCDSEFFHGKDWEILKLRLEKGKIQTFGLKKLNETATVIVKMIGSYSFSVTLFSTSGVKISPNTPMNVCKLLKKLSGTLNFPIVPWMIIFPNKMYSYNSTSCLYLLTDSRPFIHKEYSCTQSLPPHSLYYSSF